MKSKKNQTPLVSAAEQTSEVEFKFAAPEANAVFLAGNFNGWNPTDLPMHRDSEGVWRLRVPLADGHHEYRFIADGVWHDDPRACAYVPNLYGWCNCVVEVSSGTSARE